MSKIEKIKVLLLEGVHETAVNIFENHEIFEVETFPKALPENQLLEKIKEVNFLGIRSRTQVTKEVLAQATNLMSIGCFCIGTNQVDLDAAKDRGIPVFNAPFSNTRSVAELTIGSIIHLLRGIPAKNLKAHRGEWAKTAKNSFEARRKKLGIIGYGNIGSQLSIMASALGMHVYYYDVESKLSHGNAVPVDSLEELLNISDVVTVHVPALASTKNLIDAKRFSQMKEGSFLINYARGNIVDIEALVENLKSEKILGAALDVFPTEPKSNTISLKVRYWRLIMFYYRHILVEVRKKHRQILGEKLPRSLLNFFRMGRLLGLLIFQRLMLIS